MDITKNITRGLIEMYWERKCLWKVRSEEYKKYGLKKQAYKDIVAFLRRNGVADADVKMVRSKIQNLRRAMRKEKKKIADSGGTYSPTLWYYDLLSFINDQFDELQSPTTPPYFGGGGDDFEFYEDRDSNFESLDEDDNNVRSQKPSTSTDVARISSELPVEHLIQKPDEFEAMGMNVAAKVRRMESTQQVYAELLIQKVVARGLLGQLSEITEVMDLMPDSGPAMPANADLDRKANVNYDNLH